ncbi:MAG TPA: hypothetical protein VGD65_20895 [Chryseosolibacter sp.]
MKRVNNYFESELIGENILHQRILPVLPTLNENAEQLKSVSDFMRSIPTESKGVVITDAKNSKLSGSEVRIQTGQWTKENSSLIEKTIIAQIQYNTNLITSLLMKGVFLVSKPPVPVILVGTEAEAFAKANELLKLHKGAK